MSELTTRLECIATAIRECTRCGLAMTRRQAVPGEGPSETRLMLVGEAPGEVNDKEGRPFVRHGGRVFDGMLRRCGLVRQEVFISNAVRCWPPGNRRPTPKEL